VITRMSDSVTRGALDVAIEIAARIAAELGEDFRDLEAVDTALRTGKALRVYQKEYDLKKFDDLVQMIANQAVSAVVQRMDGTHDVENIILVGGAAFLFRKALKKHFPKHTIHEVADPLHANVRGFQLLGEQYVRERADLFPGAGSDAAVSAQEDA